MPCAMRSLNIVLAAYWASMCTGFLSPEISAKATMSASLTVVERLASWPTLRSSKKTPFAAVARKSLIELGKASQQQQPALIATIPLDKQLLALGNAGVPSFKSLDQLLSSFDRTGGIEDLMSVLFYGTAATNGFDQIGHYIRTEALVGSCTGYAKTVVAGCSANFTHTGPAADVASVRTPVRVAAVTSPRLRRLIRTAQESRIQPSRTAALGGLLSYLVGRGR